MNQVAMLTVDHEFTSLIQDLLDHTSSVIYIKDIEFRYLMINRQYEYLFHLQRAEILGKTDFEIFPLELAEGFRANDRHVLETGESLQCEEVAPQDDGLHNYLTLKFPLRDSTGLIYAIAGISADITDRIRAEREIAALEHRQHLILESVGDGICGIDASGLVAFLNPAAERALQWSTDDLRGKCHSKIVVGDPYGSRRIQTEMTTVSAVLNGQSATAVVNANFRRRDGSVFCVDYTVAPIHDMGCTIGAVIAFRDTTDRQKQIEIEQEIHTALRIQASLKPKQVPAVVGLEFAAMSRSCSKACGDYYDFIPWGENRLGIAVGDVSGHGLGAALEMVETRAILRTTMLTEADPVQCLVRLNELLAEDLPDDMFVTLFLAALDTSERTLTYAAAGHDATILFADGGQRRLDSTGAVLGLGRSTCFANGGTFSLRSGDLVLFATDGISETVSPQRELFGRDRVDELLRTHQSRSASDILNELQAATEAFRHGEPQRDDMTAVLIKVL